MQPKSSRRSFSRGFTIAEMLVASSLTALLALMLSSVWKDYCLTSLAAAERCRLALEANLVADSLSRDFSGNFVDKPVNGPNFYDGTSGNVLMTPLIIPNPLVANANSLKLTYVFTPVSTPDSSPPIPPPTNWVVTYSLSSQGPCLLRTSTIDPPPLPPAPVVIASDLYSDDNGLGFQVTPVEGGNWLKVQLRFRPQDADSTRSPSRVVQHLHLKTDLVQSIDYTLYVPAVVPLPANLSYQQPRPQQ